VKIAIFHVVAPCSLIQGYRRFRDVAAGIISAMICIYAFYFLGSDAFERLTESLSIS
jgi:hypothetical protein